MKKHGSEVAQENADTVSEAVKKAAKDIWHPNYNGQCKTAHLIRTEKIIQNLLDAAKGAESAAARVEPATTKDFEKFGIEDVLRHYLRIEEARFSCDSRTGDHSALEAIQNALRLYHQLEEIVASIPVDDVVGTPEKEGATLEWYAEKFSYRCGFPLITNYLRNFAALVRKYRHETKRAAASLGATPPAPGLPDKTGLLPCPFCGTKELELSETLLKRIIYVSCRSCGFGPMHHDDWNTRASLPASPWIRTAERAPTLGDGDRFGMVFVRNELGGSMQAWRLVTDRPDIYSVWMPIPPLPASLPTKPTQ